MKSNSIPSPEQEVIRYIHNAFLEAKNRRDGYSLRRFAKKIGVPAPVLSQVLNQKRKITRDLADQLLMSLQIDQDEIHKLLGRFPLKRKRRKSPMVNYTLLDQKQFQMVSDWWYYAVLALAETNDCQRSPKWIASRLNITPSQAKKAIEGLHELGLIAFKGNQMTSTGKTLTTKQDIPSTSIRRNHLQGLDLARDALEDFAVELREFSATVVSGNSAQLQLAKEEIRKMRRKIAQILEQGGKNEVYRIQIQLFPLSRNSKMTNLKGEER